MKSALEMKTRRMITRALTRIALWIIRHELRATKKEIDFRMAEWEQIDRERRTLLTALEIAQRQVPTQEYTRAAARLQRQSEAKQYEQNQTLELLTVLMQNRDKLTLAGTEYEEQLKKTA